MPSAIIAPPVMPVPQGIPSPAPQFSPVAPIDLSSLLAILLAERKSQKEDAFARDELALRENISNRQLALQQAQFDEEINQKLRSGIQNRKESALVRVEELVKREMTARTKAIAKGIGEVDRLFTKDLVAESLSNGELVLKGKTSNDAQLAQRLSDPEFGPKLAKTIDRIKDPEARAAALSKATHILGGLQEMNGVFSEAAGSLRDSLAEQSGGNLIGTNLGDFNDTVFNAIFEDADRMVLDLEDTIEKNTGQAISGLVGGGVSKRQELAGFQPLPPDLAKAVIARNRTSFGADAAAGVTPTERIPLSIQSPPLDPKTQKQIELGLTGEERAAVERMATGEAGLFSDAPELLSAGAKQLGANFRGSLPTFREPTTGDLSFLFGGSTPLSREQEAMEANLAVLNQAHLRAAERQSGVIGRYPTETTSPYNKRTDAEEFMLRLQATQQRGF